MPSQELVFDHEAIPATGGKDSAVTSTSTVKITTKRASASRDLSFDIHVKTIALSDNSATEHSFNDVRASITSDKKTELVMTLNDNRLRTTIVRQPAPNPRAPPSTSNAERLHIFNAGTRTTLVRPPPPWLLSLSADVLNATKGKGIRAPMPSVVVDVKVNVGDKVTKGQAIVILESMKTETVLRAEKDSVVKAVACAKGEMVKEGTELVSFEEDGSES